MEIKIKDVVFREDLYPRFEPDQKKIQEYSENVEVLPPIIINQDNILIDGWHRVKAHKQAGLDEIKAEVEETKSENDLYLRSVETNSTHGLQLSMKDKRSIALKLYDGKNKDRLQKALSVSDRTIRGWTTDKDKQIKEERNERIIAEYLKAENTQQQIADKFDVDKATISRLLQNGKFAEMQQDFTPFLYNIWNVSKNNNTTTHFGNIPIEFVENLIYYYTEPFDIIYDPFAGGGITIDVCKKWYRRYYVSDRKPIPAREEDIKKWDIKDGLPKDLPKPKLVFLDPPYWSQAEKQYSEDKEDLANMSYKDFLIKMAFLFQELKKKMDKGSYVAFIISASQWKNEDKKRIDHAIEFINLLEDVGYELVERIICPYSTEQYNGTQVNIAKEKKIIMNLYRDLVVMKLK